MFSWRTIFLAAIVLNESVCEDPFSKLWTSSWRNITLPLELPVTGKIPSWVKGSLVRNAGGAFETEARNVTYAFDGFPKLFKFRVSDGKVFYQERFLNTNYFQYAQAKHDIPKVPMMGPTIPPLSMFSPPNGKAGDIDNIQVWKLNGDHEVLALTDSAMVDTFDLETLDTLGQLPTDDPTKGGLIQLSCAHPQYDPASDGSVLLNFASTLLGVSLHHEIVVYRMGVDKVRRPFGSTQLPYAPYIHSFTVTKSKMVLVVYPLGFDVPCVLEFNPLIKCMHCPRDRNATVLVFDLSSADKNTKPIEIQAPYHMVMHHVNGYDEANGDVVFQVSNHDDCDLLFSAGTGNHAKLAAMKEESERDKTMAWGNLRTFRLTQFTSTSAKLSYVDTQLVDSEGYHYGTDFPYINPNYAAVYNRYFWSSTAYAKNSTHYADWAVLKVDREAAGVNTKVWFKKDHIPSEPVFVPKPGGKEDEGVLLVQVLDGVQNRGYMLVLDAATLAEVATASLEAGEHMPYSQHGRWFDESTFQSVVV